MSRIITVVLAAVIMAAAAGKQSFQVQTSTMEWKPVEMAGLPKGLQQKALHQAPDGTSSSSIARYPKGYREPRHYHKTCTHTIYILKGRLESPEGPLTPGMFIFSAKEERHGPLVAAEETEILFHTQGPFDFIVDDTKGK